MMWPDMEFYSPWFFALIPAFAGIYYFVLKKRSTPASLAYSTAAFTKMGGKSFRQRLLFLVPLTAALGMICLVFALARPRLHLVEEVVTADGIDIMLAMDISSSMLSRDFDPDRLTVSKAVAEEFVQKRPYDRIGLVVFSAEAFTLCPLTTDHNLLIDFIRGVNVGYLEDGTAIGMGLTTALNRLKETITKSKIVILITDGENNKGYIEPETAADLAANLGIRLYCIGIGTEGKAIGPVDRNYKGEYIFAPSKVTIDEALLKAMAGVTGGAYFRALDKNSLFEIYNQIDALEKTAIEVNSFNRYKEIFRYFLISGLALLFLHMLLKFILLNTLP